MTLTHTPQDSVRKYAEQSNIQIIRVTCKPSENPILREGVTELFQLYFEELLKLGCDLGFQSFQNEWVDLPGLYDFTKRGGLFLAVCVDNGDLPKETSQIVGCVAVRRFSQSCGEIKRMYVRKEYRRLGVGRLLTQAIIDHSWGDECKYDELKLDSLERLEGAVRLYEYFGFQRIPPYCECPETDHVCMSKFKS